MMNDALKQFLSESGRPITETSLRQILKEVLPAPQKRLTARSLGPRKSARPVSLIVGRPKTVARYTHIFKETICATASPFTNLTKAFPCLFPACRVSIGSVSIDFLCGSIDTDPIDPSLLIPLLIPIDPTIDPIDPIDPEIKL